MRLDLSPEPVTLVLSCDDDTQPIVWTVRAVTAVELERATREAGPVPVLGQRIVDRLLHSAEGAPDRDAAFLAALAALPPEDASEVDAAHAWGERRALSVAVSGVLAADGEHLPDSRVALESIRPARLFRRAVRELANHIEELSQLSPKARASYGRGCGSSGTPAAEAGPATSAAHPPTCTGPVAGVGAP